MTARRSVVSLAAQEPAALGTFYADLQALEVVMDLGFITTLALADSRAPPTGAQLSVASEGGSGTDVPAMSIEIGDLDAVLVRASQLGLAPTYGPVTEPWGVRRVYRRDPAGTLINTLSHS